MGSHQGYHVVAIIVASTCVAITPKTENSQKSGINMI